MAIYPLIHKPNFSYNDFLVHNQYVGDITNGIKKASTDAVKAQAMSAKILNDTINQNGNFIASTIDSGFGGISKDIANMNDNFSTGIEKVSENFGELNSNLEYGFDRLDNSMGNISANLSTLDSSMSMLNENVVYGLDEISSGIQNFHSDFNIAMGGIALQFEMQRKEMQQGFDSIVSILENRRKTDAQEDFRDGMEFYNDGYKFSDKPIWFKNAYKHLVASIEKYERNPLAHLHLAHIYHYQKDFRDFDKALEHYELCYTYAEADEKSNAITAQGYFYAGWLKASVFDDIDSAISLTKKAIEFDAKFSQAYYNLAKFYAIKKDSSNSLKYLETAIVKFDKNYIIKARLDNDFEQIDNKELYGFLLELSKDKIYKAVIAHAYLIKSTLQDDVNFSIDLTKKAISFDENFSNSYYYLAKYYALKKDSKNSLKYLEIAIVRFDKNYSIKAKLDSDFVPIEQELDKLLLKLKEDTYKSSLQKQQELKKEIDSYEIDQNDYLKISSYIKEIENYPETKRSYFDNLHLLSIISKCKTKFDSLQLKERDKYKKEIFEAINILDDEEEFSPEFTKFKNNAKRDLNPGNFKNAQQLYNTLNSFDVKVIEYFIVNGANIYSVAFSPNGKYIASGSFDRIVRIWNIENKQEIIKLLGHSHSINSVAFSPDGKYIASGSSDKTVRVWDIESKKEIIKFSGHSDSVLSISFSVDGKYIVSGSRDNTVRVWSIEKEEEITQFLGHSSYVNTVAFSPNGKYIASGSGDKIVRIWDIESKQEIAQLEGHSNLLKSVAFSPNGKYIASGSGDKTVRIWDIGSKKEIAKFSEHHDWVKSVSFSPNGKYIVSGSADNTVRVWDIERKQEIAKIDGMLIGITSVAFSPNGKYILVGISDRIKLYLLSVKLDSWKNLKEQKKIEKIKKREKRLKEQKEHEAREKEIRKKEQKLKEQQGWRENGQCEMCGAKLGFLDKMVGQARCKGCRN